MFISDIDKNVSIYVLHIFITMYLLAIY
jgi:hypothetical protein